MVGLPATLLFLVLAAPALAQVPAPRDAASEAAIAETAEAVAAHGDSDEAGGEALAEHLDALRTRPLDVNTAGAADLSALPGIDPSLAARIVAHRDAAGPISNLEALLAVDGMSTARLDVVRPYLTAAPRARRLHLDLAHRLARRLGEQQDERGRYAGGPSRLTTRLRLRRGRVAAAFTLDKDPGEALRWAPAAGLYGYDHAAGHVALAPAGRLAVLVAGDFRIEAGQGLLLGRAGAPSKGGDPVEGPVRTGRGAVPYAGAGEHAFFRGLAATLRAGPHARVTAFASHRRLDAARGGATTLVTTGLHRTPEEHARRRALGARTVGGTASWTRGGAHAVVTAYSTRFAEPLRPPPAPYRHHDPAGRYTHGVSAAGHLGLGSALLFGEIAWTRGGGGGLGGLRLRMPAGTLIVAARRYAPGFDAPYGTAFSERSGAPRNEQGLYLGLRLPLGAWTLEGYADTYRFPWLRYGVGRPSTGRDGLLRLRFAPRRWLDLTVQVRHEMREDGVTAEQGRRLLTAVAPRRRTTARLDAAYVFGPRLRLRARLDGTRAHPPDAPDAVRGMLLLHDVRFQPHPRVRLHLRLALFDVGDYAARIYTYEHDVRHAFTVPAFSGIGTRRYLLAVVDLTRRLTAEGRVAVTHYEHAQAGGSNPDGTQRREVGLQLRWRR